MSTVKEKKAELVLAIEKEIVSAVTKSMNENFKVFLDRLVKNTRDDQMERIFGKEVIELVKEYNKALS